MGRTLCFCPCMYYVRGLHVDTLHDSVPRSPQPFWSMGSCCIVARSGALNSTSFLISSKTLFNHSVLDSHGVQSVAAPTQRCDDYGNCWHTHVKVYHQSDDEQVRLPIDVGIGQITRSAVSNSACRRLRD